MTSLSCAFLGFLVYACYFVQTCLTTDSTNTTECAGSGVEPDDEISDFDSVFYQFAQKLEFYTGLNATEKFSVKLDRCEGRICAVNPKGDAIWQARMDFYVSNMMDAKETEAEKAITLDGCLCYSTDVSDYQNCMINVRRSMIDQLDTVLIAKFKSIVENDCNSFSQNCISV